MERDWFLFSSLYTWTPNVTSLNRSNSMFQSKRMFFFSSFFLTCQISSNKSFDVLPLTNWVMPSSFDGYQSTFKFQRNTHTNLRRAFNESTIYESTNRCSSIHVTLGSSLNDTKQHEQFVQCCVFFLFFFSIFSFSLIRCLSCMSFISWNALAR